LTPLDNFLSNRVDEIGGNKLVAVSGLPRRIATILRGLKPAISPVKYKFCLNSLFNGAGDTYLAGFTKNKNKI